MDKFVTIARVSGVHGIRGQLKVQSFTEPYTSLSNYKKLYWNLNNTWQLMPIVKNSLKLNGQSFVVDVIDCHDRDEARKYQFTEIAVPRDALPKLDPVLDEGQYYWIDLEGVKVYTTYSSDNLSSNKTYLGIIDQIIATGSNDVLVVKDPELKKEYLVPYLFGKYVLSVDIEQGEMIVDWDPEF